MPQSIIVTGAGPLITLAVARALDALLLPRLPVIIPDMVRLAILQILDQPGAREVAEWIRRHDGHGVRVACTEVYEEFEVLRGVNAATKTGSRCEQAAVEVFWAELERRDAGAILLFDDNRVTKQNFLGRLPDEAVLTSMTEFLEDLEQRGLWTSAARTDVSAVEV